MKEIIRKIVVSVIILSIVAIIYPESIFASSMDSVIKKNNRNYEMVLVNRTSECLEDGYVITIEDYEEKIPMTRAVETKQGKRVYTITNTTKGTIAVQFTFYATFTYKNKWTCTDKYVYVDNRESNNFEIVNQNTAYSGTGAVAYCYAVNKHTGTMYGRTMYIQISAGGTISYP